MTAKEYLNRGYRMELRIKSMTEEVERLDALSKRTTAVYGTEAVSRTRRTDSGENAIIRLTEAKRKLDDGVRELMNIREEIHTLIDSIADTDSRLILEFRYLHMNSWQEIQFKFQKSKTQVFRMHRIALSMAETVLATERRLGHDSGSNG